MSKLRKLTALAAAVATMALVATVTTLDSDRAGWPEITATGDPTTPSTTQAP